MPKIFIDPGAVDNGMRESDINLAVTLRLGELLRGAGADVRYSRTTDTRPSISERARLANAWAADYFVSIHVNAAGGTGGETFIAATKPQDRAFAQAVNDPYCAAMGLRNRGVKLDSASPRGRFDALRETRMPAVLVELAFIDSPPSNPDVPILRNRRSDMAAALADALLAYLGVAQTPAEAVIPTTVPSTAGTPSLVRVTAPLLNIRRGPGTNHAIAGTITDRGTYTITEVQQGQGSRVGWGRLKSGAGWIALCLTERRS
jgi:N-acetylmuramoyl-L-alanine amidase